MVLIFDDDSSDSEDDYDIDDGEEVGKSERNATVLDQGFGKRRQVFGLNGKDSSRPPLSTDAYLSIDTESPSVAPSTAASEWHIPVRDMVSLPIDRIITKSWYSAFKETSLLQILRSRIITQLCIVGLMTNVGILATAADAAKHGLEVWILDDCLGYRDEAAHDGAIQIMVEDFAVQSVNSDSLMKTWNGQKSRAQSTVLQPAMELTGISAQVLSKMMKEQKVAQEKREKHNKLLREMEELMANPLEIDPDEFKPALPSPKQHAGKMSTMRDSTSPVANVNDRISESIKKSTARIPKLLIPKELDAETARLKICLYEKKINFTERVIADSEIGSFRSQGLRGKPPIFIDKNSERTAIDGSLAVLIYLDTVYSSHKLLTPPSTNQTSYPRYARALTRLYESQELLGLSETLQTKTTREEKTMLMDNELEIWERYLQTSTFAVDKSFSLVDVAVFPALYSVFTARISLSSDDEKEQGKEKEKKTWFPAIRRYIDMIKERKSVIKVYGHIPDTSAQFQPMRAGNINDNEIDALEQLFQTVTVTPGDGEAVSGE
jgi:glutathione S-transferase